MARRPDLEAFAEQHGMKISTIAALIRYRMQNEKTVERVADAPDDHRVRSVPGIDLSGCDQPAGAFRSGQGRDHPEQPVLVRVHVQTLC
jgi:3,4-dihydroxy 2-butanone 4-phosphate synthase/GTP cyclohydrolase II